MRLVCASPGPQRADRMVGPIGAGRCDPRCASQFVTASATRDVSKFCAFSHCVSMVSMVAWLRNPLPSSCASTSPILG